MRFSEIKKNGGERDSGQLANACRERKKLILHNVLATFNCTPRRLQTGDLTRGKQTYRVMNTLNVPAHAMKLHLKLGGTLTVTAEASRRSFQHFQTNYTTSALHHVLINLLSSIYAASHEMVNKYD